MKKKFTILSLSIAATSFVFAQQTSRLEGGNNHTYPNFVRFDLKNAPLFANSPVVFDEVNQKLSPSAGHLIFSDTDQLGFTTYKYQQQINGIPVEHGIQNVQVKERKIIGTSGVWYKANEGKILKTPKISEAIALENALSFVGATKYKWQDQDEENLLKTDSKNVDATYFPKGELVYYTDPGGENHELILAYKFNIYAEQPLSRSNVFVSAVDGKILSQNALIHDTNITGSAVTGYSGTQSIVTDKVSATSYRLRETGRNGGTAIETYNLKKGTNYASAVDFTDTDNVWNNVNTSKDQYAADAHWGAEKTVDYLKVKFNRNSIDNNHFPIKSYVHYSRSYFNAFWDGQRMTYGDGSSLNGGLPLTALDVCAHEIGHGMTSKSANLVYQKEPGAMNEGFSDILGNSVELWARPNKASWKLGEDFNYVIRDMANPNAYKQPDTYMGTYWISTNCTPSQTNDYCGVHTNSGVLNFWYYLLVNGGSGTNDKGFVYNVSGIGLDKAAQVAYRTLTTYLSSSSTYLNARTYSLQAAADLYGSGSNEVVQVTNAWNAVGVGGGTSPAGKIAPQENAYTLLNLSNGRFILNFENQNDQLRNFEVISSTGVKVYSKMMRVEKGTNAVEIQIPGSTLSGVYQVIVNGQRAGAIIKK